MSALKATSPDIFLQMSWKSSMPKPEVGAAARRWCSYPWRCRNDRYQKENRAVVPLALELAEVLIAGFGRGRQAVRSTTAGRATTSDDAFRQGSCAPPWMTSSSMNKDRNGKPQRNDRPARKPRPDAPTSYNFSWPQCVCRASPYLLWRRSASLGDHFRVRGTMVGEWSSPRPARLFRSLLRRR